MAILPRCVLRPENTSRPLGMWPALIALSSLSFTPRRTWMLWGQPSSGVAHHHASITKLDPSTSSSEYVFVLLNAYPPITFRHFLILSLLKLSVLKDVIYYVLLLDATQTSMTRTVRWTFFEESTSMCRTPKMLTHMLEWSSPTHQWVILLLAWFDGLSWNVSWRMSGMCVSEVSCSSMKVRAEGENLVNAEGEN